MAGGSSKGNSQPRGHGRQSEKKVSDKRKRSGNNSSGFTPDDKKDKKTTPVDQESKKHVKQANPSPASDASNGKASTSALEASMKAAKIVDDTVTEGVINQLFDEDATDELLRSDDEDMSDLTEKAEENIGKDELGVKPTEESQDKTKDKSYAAAASGKSVRGYEVLYIHSGVKERDRIESEVFFKLWDRIDFDTMERMLNGESVPGAGVLWKKWIDGRGLIAVSDKETSDWVCEIVSKTQVKGKSFKAWHRGDYGLGGRLVTGYLRGNAFKGRTGEQLMTLLKKQNLLAGKHTGVLIRDRDDGRVFRLFADPTLWKDLVSRRLHKSRRGVLLKLGLGMVKFVLSKDKPDKATPTPTAGEGADNQQNQPASDASNGEAGDSALEPQEEMVVEEEKESEMEDEEAKANKDQLEQYS